jgi:peptidoglycan/xylan/chitin deacetylase (PgdA/CDA1 family)
MLRNAFRNTVALACYGSGTLAFYERLVGRSLTILAYHRVLPAEQKVAYFDPELAVTPETFREHCVVLGKHYTVLPLAAAVDALKTEPRTSLSDRPLAAVTFDDGYRDNLIYAAPVLEQNGLRATFFPVADLVGSNVPPWYDRAARALMSLARRGSIDKIWRELEQEYSLGTSFSWKQRPAPVNDAIAASKRLGPDQRKALLQRVEMEAGRTADWRTEDLIMDFTELRRLDAQGHEIGSHGCSHEILTGLGDARLVHEVTDSRKLLEAGLDRSVRSFSYPNGNVDERVSRAVQNAGYQFAVTTETGSNNEPDNPYLLKRWFIDETRLRGVIPRVSNALLRMELCGLADRVFLRKSRKK